MNELIQFIAPFISTLERYTLSNNPQATIKELPQESLQKKFINLINEPYSAQLAKRYKNIGMSDAASDFLSSYQMFKSFQKAKLQNDRKKLLQSIIKKYEIKFQHSKPIQSYKKQQNTQSAPSIFNLSQSAQKIIRQFYQKEKCIDHIFDNGLILMGKNFISTLTVEEKENFLLRSIVEKFEPDFIVSIILEVYNESLKPKRKATLPYGLQCRLTKQQLKQVKEKIPKLFDLNQSYLIQWISSKFDNRMKLMFTTVRNLTVQIRLQKKALLADMRRELKTFKNAFSRSLQFQLLMETLVNDLALQKAQKDLFIEFLQNIPVTTSLLNSKHSKQIKMKFKNQKNYSFNYLYESKTENWDIQRLIKQYVIQLYKKENYQRLTKELGQFLIEQYLKSAGCQVKLKKGQFIENIENIIAPQQLANLKSQKYITIIHKNQFKWRVDQDIVLNLKIKNINEVNVKIYQLDLQKQAIKNFSIDAEFGTQDLSYLDPSYAFIYKTDCNNPFKQNIVQLPIKQIQKRAGGYIILLQGEGICSKAAIRKGSIICLTKTTLAGQKLKFYDEGGKKLENVTVWIKGKKIENKDFHIIPFGQNEQKYEIIMVKDGNVGFSQVYVPSEKYELDIKYFNSNQSFIVGNQTKIVICPILRINKNIISLKMLKNTNIVVDIIDHHDIQSQFIFTDIEWSSNLDYVLAFPIQTYIKSIRINIQSQIQSYSGKIIKLSSSKDIKIQLPSLNSVQFIDAYLQKIQQKYVVSIYGLNGEPLPNINILLRYSVKYIEIQQEVHLSSDSLGKIYLGKLQNVVNIEIEIGQTKRIWNIQKLEGLNPETSQIAFIKTIVCKIGQVISLPLPYNLNIENDLYFRRTSSYLKYGENVKQKLSVSQNRLIIKSLDQGQYNLQFYSLDVSISIYVFKDNKDWSTQNQIYDSQENTLYQITKDINKSIGISDAIVSIKQEEIQIQINFNIPQSIKTQTIKIHCFLTNFIQSELEFKDCTSEVFRQSFQRQLFMQPQSNYLSNQYISQEKCYVFNRQNQPQYAGNNLAKPKIFLKKIQAGNTHSKDQSLDQSAAYYGSLPKKRLMATKLARKGGKGGKGVVGSKRYVNRLKNQLTAHNNFLLNPSIVFTNLSNRKLKLNIQKGYSSIRVILISSQCILHKVFNINDNSTIKMKDIRHNGLIDEDQNKGWAMSRECYHVINEQSITINRNTQWSAIGLSHICQYAKTKGVKMDDWILNWNNYSQAKKLTVYDKQYCHELNLYLYQNDRIFFKKVVKPFLENKVIKTFIDLFLLQDQQCLNFNQITKFIQLNEFEKVLLVRRLINQAKKQQAQQVLQTINMTDKSNKISMTTFNHEFDTVINAKQDKKSQQMEQIVKLAQKKQKMSKRSRSQKDYQVDQSVQDDYAEEDEENAEMLSQNSENDSISNRMLDLRSKYQKGFQQMEKTKQFRQITYSGLKQTPKNNLINPSLFWSKLAAYFFDSKNNQFITESFLYLKTKLQFSLAACFLTHLKPNFEIKSDKDTITIKSKSNFLLFVKQVKCHPFQIKAGIMINQRFFDPSDRWKFQQSGSKVEKNVQQFVMKKVYCVQTVVTNTSGTSLEVQILVDIPQGSIPVKTTQCSLNIQCEIKAYNTFFLQTSFYFPYQGKYTFYPANASRNRTIIAKAIAPKIIQVKSHQSKFKISTLSDIMRFGNHDNVIEYLQTKNIFDQIVFTPSKILWMLKQKSFFLKVMKTLKKRRYYNQQIWSYGLYHSNYEISEEYISTTFKFLLQQFQLPIFQYFPYYSKRCHKFQNKNKNTILNNQFRASYFKAIIISILENNKSSIFKITMIYYLLLQDRIDEAMKFFQGLTQKQRQQHKIQFDYIQCFVDICKGYPNFAKAKKISALYKDYPVISWKQLFNQVTCTLNQFQTNTILQKNIQIQYQTVIIKQKEHLKIQIPMKTSVKIMFYSLNLQLYFSMFPFDSFNLKEAMKPTKQICLDGSARQQLIIRPETIKDPFVVIQQSKQGTVGKIISQFHWSNPDIKVKLSEQQGTLKVFYKTTRVVGCYCKIFSKGQDGIKFYRDGYTDIIGNFKYVLADLENITCFSILCMSEYGGVILKAGIPNTLGTIIA